MAADHGTGYRHKQWPPECGIVLAPQLSVDFKPV